MTTIKAKADYALSEARKGSGDHHCHWPGCDKRVPPAMWGCKGHWFALPFELRTRIWRAYRMGQEVNKTPSRQYVAIAREAQAWIAAHYPDGLTGAERRKP